MWGRSSIYLYTRTIDACIAYVLSLLLYGYLFPMWMAQQKKQAERRDEKILFACSERRRPEFHKIHNIVIRIFIFATNRISFFAHLPKNAIYCCWWFFEIHSDPTIFHLRCDIEWQFIQFLPSKKLILISQSKMC